MSETAIIKAPNSPRSKESEVNLVEPSKIIEVDDIFRIVYKDGSNITYKNFSLARIEDESPKEHLGRAINRAFKFCERMRYRFIHCDPFIIDLDVLEQRMQGM